MSAHVLMILLNEPVKRDKMRGWPSNVFNKFNKTRARMLDLFIISNKDCFEVSFLV